MQILLSNDDGILAPGLAALHRELAELGEVTVVAPESAQSAAAHAITLEGPLAVRQVHVQDQFVGYSVEGRPADCVKLAITELLDGPPDLVVSGINDGANVSINVLYSGTVAAAAEGALLGYPAVAVSLRQGVERDFNRAAKIARPIIKKLLDTGLSAGELININITDLTQGSPRGKRVVPQATRMIEDKYDLHTEPDGRDYYWLMTPSDFEHVEDDVDSDLAALNERYITITPLHFDLTHYEHLKMLRQEDWMLEL
ncbi:MAG: 5'/3'-nucleotidase SurE [Planctomycetota bacterium]|nr:MAG: 5'/3'-nucleotidase SurE [Planctomycetota bacterium]